MRCATISAAGVPNVLPFCSIFGIQTTKCTPIKSFVERKTRGGVEAPPPAALFLRYAHYIGETQGLKLLKGFRSRRMWLAEAARRHVRHFHFTFIVAKATENQRTTLVTYSFCWVDIFFLPSHETGVGPAVTKSPTSESDHGLAVVAGSLEASNKTRTWSINMCLPVIFQTTLVLRSSV